MKYIKNSEQHKVYESNDEVQRIKELLTSLFDRRNLRVDIREKNLDFTLSVRVPKNPKFDQLLNVLEAFRSVDNAMEGYASEIDMWYPEFYMVLERTGEEEEPESRMPF